MDPTLFPFMSPTAGVPGLQGTLGAGAIPQQPAQAPVGAPNTGVLQSLRNLISGPGGQMQGPAPDFSSMQSTLNPFISSSQNVPYFPPAPAGTGSVPMPQPRPAEAPQGENPTRTGLDTGGGKQGQGLMDALRGVKAPAPPQAQTVRTPPPPQLAPIKGGEFVSMLSSLGITPQEFIRMRMGGLGGR